MLDVDQISRMIARAYLAGIIDGEGCIGIEHLRANNKSRKKDYYLCRLTVINTDEELMKKLIFYFKGSYSMRKKIEGRKPCFAWRVFGDNQKMALQELYPYLYIKKPQAKLVLEYIDTIGKTGWHVTNEVLQKRKELWEQCKLLNSGPDK